MPTLLRRARGDDTLDLKRQLPLTHTHTNTHTCRNVGCKEAMVFLRYSDGCPDVWCGVSVVDAAAFGAMRLLCWVSWQRGDNVATWTA